MSFSSSASGSAKPGNALLDGLCERAQQSNDERRGRDRQLEAAERERDAELEQVALRELPAFATARGLGEVGLDHALLAEVNEHVLRHAEAELNFLQRYRLAARH